MANLSALQRKTADLVLEARRRRPEKDNGFIWTRELFSADEWARLEAFRAEIEPLYQWYRNGWVNYHGLSQDQLDRLLLWAMLQHERESQHSEHAAIVLLWLETPWSDQAAQLVAASKRYKIPDAFHYELQRIERGQADTVHNGYRREIRRYLLQQDQGIDYEPCICKRS